jgi:hypothetical protein
MSLMTNRETVAPPLRRPLALRNRSLDSALEPSALDRHSKRASRSATPAPWATTLFAWAAMISLLLIGLAATHLAHRPPVPLSTSAPPTEFSEDRAWPVLVQLSETIGFRVAGTPNHDRAAAFLRDALASIPRLEVIDASAEECTRREDDDVDATCYRARNVLARLPGADDRAVLLSAHYDSPPESPGAGDDAVAVAVIVEVARILAAAPKLPHSVIFNLNGLEEGGLLGAAAFVHHPWAREVRAFINLESAGPGGKAILFQSGPPLPWLLRAYAQGVPAPFASVVAQDIFQSGVVPSDTDFHVYRNAGHWPGFDIALFEDGYAYHTALDRAARVSRGSVQHMGDTALGLLRALASKAPSDTPDEAYASDGYVYYDLLGRLFFLYRKRMARALAIGTLVLVIALVAWLYCRGFVTRRTLVEGAAATGASVLLGTVVGPAVAYVLAVPLDRPFGWFSSPTLAIVTFGAIALTAGLLPHAVWARRCSTVNGSAETLSFAVWSSTLVLFAALGAALAWKDLGIAYLAAWWVIPSGLGLLGTALLPRLRLGWVGLSLLPGLATSLPCAALLLDLFVPLAGRTVSHSPFDVVVATLVTLPIATCLAFASPELQRAGRLPAVALGCALIAVMGTTVLATRFPYSPNRPKRLWLEHQDAPSGGRIVIRDFDTPPLKAIWKGHPIAGATLPELHFDERYELPAGPLSVDPPVATLRSHEATLSGRSVVLDVACPDSIETLLTFTGPRILSWSAADLPAPRQRSDVRLRMVAQTSLSLRLELDGSAPLRMEAKSTYATDSAALRSLTAQLPAWTTPFAFVTAFRQFEW